MAARRRAESFSPKTSCRLRVSKVDMLDMAYLLWAYTAVSADFSSDLQDDFAADVAGRAHLLSPARFRERQHRIDEHLALAGVDKLRDLSQGRRTGCVVMHGGAHSIAGCLIRRRRRDERDENPALAQHFPGTLLDLA